MRLLLVLALGACFFPWLSSCGLNDPTADDRPTVGVILPFTNSMGVGAEQMHSAMVNLIPEDSPKMRLVFRDDSGNPSQTSEIVREFASDDGILAVVGAMTSPCALAAAERAESLGLPFITPMATNAGITQGRDWTFRLCFTDPQQGAQMARFAWGELNVKKVAIIRDVKNDYSLGLADAFSETFLGLGGQIVAERSYRLGLDGGEGLTRWLESNSCDAIYLPLYEPEIVDIISKSIPTWKGTDLVFLGGDGWHSAKLRDFLQTANAVPEDIFITAHFAWDKEDERVAMLLDQSRRKKEPIPTSATALGHDTVQLLLNVLRPGITDRVDVRDGIKRELGRFQGATGSFEFDPETHEMIKDVNILSWDGQRWTSWD